MKKLYSNKEIVAFDDDEDQPAVAAAGAAPAGSVPILAESPSMSPKDNTGILSRSQRTDKHVYSSNSRARTQRRPSSDDDDAPISDDMIDALLAELSASAVNKRRPQYYDDDAILWDYVDEPSSSSNQRLDDLIELAASEDDMNANEVGQSLGDRRKLMNELDETADMFRAASLAAAAARKKQQEQQQDQMSGREPVNTVDVSEKLVPENEYNNELKAHAPHKEEKSSCLK